MPTLNNDSTAIAVHSSTDAAQQRSRRIVGISLGATLVTVLVLFAAMALAPVDADAANTCTLTSTTPTTLWSDTTRWSGCGGTYPGAGAGDTAVVSLSPGLLKVDVTVPNGVVLQLSGFAPVQVASGAALTLESSSTATSSNSFTVVSGGTFGVDTGVNLSTWQSPVNINGGTFNVLGAISFTNGAQLTFSGGTVQGGGTITIPSSQAATFTGSTGAMTITGGTIIDNFGSLTLSSSANALSVNNGATIKNESSGAFGLSGDAPINTDNVASPLINNIGTLAKTGGTSSAIGVPLNNSGTVNAGSATIGFSGSGTHSGSFVSGSTTSIAFSGSNTFNSGTSFSGAAPVQFLGGTQTFNASINATGGVTWSGGTIAGTGPLNVSSSLTLDGASSAMTLTGVLKTTATVSYAPTNLLTINGASAVFETAYPGSFSIAGDYDILASPSGTGIFRVTSLGNVTKTAGSSGSAINAYVDNQSGTIANSSSAPLNLAGGGSSTGSITASSASSIINFTGGTFDSSGTFGGSGSVNVAGGTLNVNAATTFSGTPNLGISSGTLGGTGAITLSSASTWSGGSITGSNSFAISSPGSLTLTGANGAMTLDGRTLTNANQLTFNSPTNSLTLKNAASISNAGTFTVSSAGGTIDTDTSATTVTNTINGSLAKTSAAGTFLIKPTFNQAGSVSITGGVLDIFGAGTNSGAFTIASGAEVWYPTPASSTYTWASGTAFNGGKVTVDGPGTVATTAVLAINNTNLVVDGGTFSSGSTLTVTTPGTLAWKGGALTGAGHTVISANTTFDMSTESAARIVSGHTIDNNGNATLVASTQPPTLNDGSIFNNNSGAVFNITSAGGIATNANLSNAFNNAGTVKKTSGGNSFTFTAAYTQSAGTTDCADPASTIAFNNGSDAMSGGSLTASNATCKIDLTGGSFTITGGSLSGPGPIELKGAILNVNAATTFPATFNMSSGSLAGTQTITIPNAAAFNWSGGSITGGAAAPITVNSGGTINADTTTSSLIYNTRPLVISPAGNFNWNSGGNAIIFQSGSSVNDSGTFTVGTTGTLGNSAGSFAVNGQFTHSGSGTVGVSLPLTVQSGGTMTSSGGGAIALIYSAGVSHAGTFDAQSGSVISFSAGTHQFNSGAAFSAGTGTYALNGATLNLNTNVSAPKIALTGGSVTGSGNLTSTSTFAWSGGTMSGTGTTQINGTGSFTSGPLTLNRNLLIGGNTSMNAAGGLSVQTTAAITNNATFTLQNGDVSCSSCTTAAFANNGSIVQNTANLIHWSVPITGSGSLSVTAGTFFDQASANFGSAGITSSTASFSGSPITVGSLNATNGVFEVTGGATTVSGATTLGGGASQLRVSGGTLTLNGASSVDGLLMTAGTLSGNGNVNITSGTANQWSGGTISGSGVLTVNSGVTLQLAQTSAITLDARPLINSGTLTYPVAANGLTLANGAVITNASGANLNLDGTSAIAITGSGNGISNSGTLNRGATGTLGIAPSVANTATINANAGTLAFNGGLTQSSGSTNLLGGSISSTSAIALAGGSLTGNGTVAAPVNNSGASVAPGSATASGTIAINGAYNQSGGGSMNLKIGGTSNYDVVDVSTSGVTLAGTLNATLFNSFTPSSGNAFDVLKFSTRSGDFTTYNLPTFAGGGSIQSGYVSGTPNLLRLTAVVTQADLGITQSVPASVLHGQNGTWTVTVTNGPNPATNVVVTDTFANASFVSATSAGPCTPSGSTVTCAIGSLAANQSVNLTLMLNASSLSTITNSASVSASEFDPNTSNNSVGPASTTVLPAADLSLSNVASSNPVNAGSPLSFSLTVSNAGPDTTSGTASISNTFPAGVTSFTFSGTGWSCGALSGSVATCTTSTPIASSGSAPSLVLSMTAPASGPATDSATVSAGTGDPNNANNSASQSVAVTPRADLLVTKSGAASVNAGQSIVYTVVVTNNGPSSATGVSVADPTPAGLTFVSNSGGCTTIYPCALGTMTNGQSVTITSTYTTSSGSAGTSVTNTATASSTTSDPNTANNAATQTTAVNGSADLTITKSGPASAIPGSTLVYTITVANNGPSDATAVVVNDATPAGTTFVSNSGACTTAFPCSLGTMTVGQSLTITSTFSTASNFTGSSVSNTATVSSATADPVANNSATATTAFGPSVADLSITKSGPASASTGNGVSYTIVVANNGPGAAINVVVDDPTPTGLAFVSATGACSSFPCNVGNLAAGQTATILASYNVTATSGSIVNTANVTASSSDPSSGNNAASATTQIGTISCGQQPPTLIAPANGVTIGSPVTFSWTAVQGASNYKLFAAVGGASTQEIGNTTGTSLALPLSGGTVVWSVQALGVPNCGQLTSANGTFNVCDALTAPVISVVGTSSSGQSYTVQWTAIPGVTNYELQEASTQTFDNPQTFAVADVSKGFTKNANTPAAFFYRVRALSSCNQGAGPYSAAERVVIVPIPPAGSPSPSATVDINNKHVVIQTVFIPGQGTAIPFTATTDQPWLTVTPSSGVLPAAGITLTVSADPADLPNGTFTATIILSFSAAGKVGILDTKPPVAVPISISVVTPVSPATLSTPPANSLIIPAVGHLDGINSQWRSDVRITNTAAQKINYLLRFTPAGGDPSQIKQTQITIAANDTMALDDIVKNWYGVGALGDAANGVLEVRPLVAAGKGTPVPEDVSVATATVASSRTYNQSAGGTLGQYIPAIAFANFVGKVSGSARDGILSMQQIAQSPAFRTNLGIVEAAGKPASVLISVFDTAGKNLLDIPLDLKAGEQQQLNSFLAAKNIVLADGRAEVKVTSGDGKVMAYASVVDNRTGDPLLVTGTPVVQPAARSFVLPGVADLSNGGANWRSDVRIFNAGTVPQFLTMTLYPLTGSGSDTLSRSMTVNAGAVAVLDNIVASTFGVTNAAGAMHVDTGNDSNLVVTGRTYNQVDGGGTYGQFIGAVTPADGVGKGGRTLNVLQVEDSTRYRTNLGIAEVSGKPATVEVSVFLPDAKVAQKVTIPFAANEYRQFRVLQQLGVGTAYNARVTIRVVDGDGKITAYGSVIDMQTQDPTYVPAQ
jgi:uncharacterized repeat protein (TIGR01451 family)